MKLQFDLYQKGKYIGVNIYCTSPGVELFDDWDNSLHSREYLEEAQYDRIANWCIQTFNTKVYPMRVRRMAYADFWFSSNRDLDWFILQWSGVDSESV